MPRQSSRTVGAWALALFLLAIWSVGCADIAGRSPPSSSDAPAGAAPAVDGGPDGGATSPGSAPGSVTPSGTVRVAYPEEPGSWYPGSTDEPAAVDLAALWGLPLYRVDAFGQLRPGLAESAVVRPGSDAEPRLGQPPQPGGVWEVDVRLRPGSWSDGRRVTSADVVASVAALRGVRTREWEPLLGAEAVDEGTVRLRFSRPYPRWPYLLAGGITVLPAQVLAQQGVAAYQSGIPVSGGPFRLERHDPGLRAVFVANPGSPLGSPGLERVEVWFTPSYETALGLLRDRRVDVVLGYLAPNPVQRALRVQHVRADAPVGGTWALLRWRAGGALEAAELRRAARGAVDSRELAEGLLGRYGEVMTSLIPGVGGSWQSGGRTGGSLAGVSLEVLLPQEQELPALTARLLQDELRRDGASVDLVRLDADVIEARARAEGDGALLIRRDLPRPSLAAHAPPGASPPERARLLDADSASVVTSGLVDVAQHDLFSDAWEIPLYRVGLAQAWHEQLAGVRASSWPGLAFWDVTAWRWSPPGPPPQAPTLRPP